MDRVGRRKYHYQHDLTGFHNTTVYYRTVECVLLLRFYCDCYCVCPYCQCTEPAECRIGPDLEVRAARSGRAHTAHPYTC